MKRICMITAILALLATAALAAHAAQPPAWLSDAQDLALRDGYALVDDGGLADLGVAGEDYLLIDARPDYEFAAGHIPGSVNFEFDLGDRAGLKPDKRAALEALLGADKDRPVVVYCRSFR